MAEFLVTYGDVPVCLSDPDGRVESWLRSPLAAQILPLVAPPYEGRLFRDQWPLQPMGGVGSGNYHPLPPWELNKLVWPMGASRFAYCLILLTADDLQLIYDDAAAATQPFRTLHIECEDTEAVDVEMTYLPPIPLGAAAALPVGEKGQGDLYLLPLVDRRYEMQAMSSSVIQEHVGEFGTWVGYIDDKANATMGGYIEAVDTDTITEKYFGPDAETFYRSLTSPGVFLDAVAASLGGHWVSYPTADQEDTLHLARWETYLNSRDGLPETTANPLIAGHHPDDGVSQLFASFAESYQVTFPVYKWGARCRRFYTAEWTIDDLELEIPLDRIVKRTGFIQSIYSTAHADHSIHDDGDPGGGDIDNQVDIDTLSKQLARDAVCRSMPHPAVQVYAGIYPLDHTGGDDAGDAKLHQLAWADRVEFCFDRGQCFTRWVGLPHSYGPHFNLSQFEETALYTSPAEFSIPSGYEFESGDRHTDGWNATLASTNPNTHGTAVNQHARLYNPGAMRGIGWCLCWWNVGAEQWQIVQKGCS